MKTVNLVLLTDLTESTAWTLGQIYFCQPTAEAINSILQENLSESTTDAWLFWDLALGEPPIDLVIELLDTSADCWHAGLLLGLGGKPEMIDFVAPTWMLNRDPDKTIEATSWRLSLRACMIRTDVLRQLGGPSQDFDSLEAGSLDLGLRYIRRGVFVRYVPGLIPIPQSAPEINISLRDQLLFVRNAFGLRWLKWARLRAWLTRFACLPAILKTMRFVRKLPHREYPTSYERPQRETETPVSCGVSVLIPTLKRYPYLQVLLGQLRNQTVPALEILVIDQTPQAERNLDLKDQFSDLPIHWCVLDQAGQCSSRNFGLERAKGEFILFLDDDDEIKPDLIERHLVILYRYKTNISNGVAVEVRSGKLPADFQLLRVSDVFPTNNTLIRKSVLERSGLFDLAYDHGQRADHDLGMRLYLNGELMVLDPNIEILHHHAPMGGLREHKARVDTYAASRRDLFKQVLPGVSDIYLSMRYFSERQVREGLWIDVFGTFSMRGSQSQRLGKALIALLSLPNNIRLIRQRAETAEKMLERYPQIPVFPQEKS